MSSVQLPTSMSNTGGTWDNAKKDTSTSKRVPMVLTLRANMLMTLFLPHAHFFIICHVHAVRTRCMPTDRSSGNFHKKIFTTDETATLHESYTKNGRISITDFVFSCGRD